MKYIVLFLNLYFLTKSLDLSVNNFYKNINYSKKLKFDFFFYTIIFWLDFTYFVHVKKNCCIFQLHICGYTSSFFFLFLKTPFWSQLSGIEPWSFLPNSASIRTELSNDYFNVAMLFLISLKSDKIQNDFHMRQVTNKNHVHTNKMWIWTQVSLNIVRTHQNL
jgi:hypothetical protein